MEKLQWHKISDEMVDALAKVAKKHGVTFESNGFTYYDDKCSFKTLATVNDSSGQKRDLEREAFVRVAKQHPNLLNIEWLDKQFTDKGSTYTVVGFKPGARRGVGTRRDDGKIYFWAVDFVKERFAVAA